MLASKLQKRIRSARAVVASEVNLFLDALRTARPLREFQSMRFGSATQSLLGCPSERRRRRRRGPWSSSGINDVSTEVQLDFKNRRRRVPTTPIQLCAVRDDGGVVKVYQPK